MPFLCYSRTNMHFVIVIYNGVRGTDARHCCKAMVNKSVVYSGGQTILCRQEYFRIIKPGPRNLPETVGRKQHENRFIRNSWIKLWTGIRRIALELRMVPLLAIRLLCTETETCMFMISDSNTWDKDEEYYQLPLKIIIYYFTGTGNSLAA
jgi:hypothetical protein